MSPITTTEAERAAVELLAAAASAFDRFCEALEPLSEEWKYGSVYNLLITYDELGALHENEELLEDPHDVLIKLARGGLVVGPYDADGHSSQAVADELSEALAHLGGG